MNDLSWMLYAVNVLQSLGIIFVVLCVALGAALFIACLIAFLSSMDGYNKTSDNMKAAAIRIAWFFIPLLLLSALLPSNTTLHLILASELGETAVTNPEVIEIFELLKENLKNYISK